MLKLHDFEFRETVRPDDALEVTISVKKTLTHIITPALAKSDANTDIRAWVKENLQHQYWDVVYGDFKDDMLQLFYELRQVRLDPAYPSSQRLMEHVDILEKRIRTIFG